MARNINKLHRFDLLSLLTRRCIVKSCRVSVAYGMTGHPACSVDNAKVPAFSCIDATVPLCVSPSLSCKNKVVLPEPDGPSSSTAFPFPFDR